jgi:hypothetical protein
VTTSSSILARSVFRRSSIASSISRSVAGGCCCLHSLMPVTIIRSFFNPFPAVFPPGGFFRLIVALLPRFPPVSHVSSLRNTLNRTPHSAQGSGVDLCILKESKQCSLPGTEISQREHFLRLNSRFTGDEKEPIEQSVVTGEAVS